MKPTSHAFWERLWKTADPQRLAEYDALPDADGDPVAGFLRERGAVRVCDAGCGSGAYARKLAAHGFLVSGFDLSPGAAALAAKGNAAGSFLAADILDTPYPDAAFDAVVARSVLDHMPRADAVRAVRELLRITRPGGCVVLTLDATDEDYESRPHFVDRDGDYVYTAGKWEGMVFHPFTSAEISALAPGYGVRILKTGAEGFTAVIEKGE